MRIRNETDICIKLLFKIPIERNDYIMHSQLAKIQKEDNRKEEKNSKMMLREENAKNEMEKRLQKDCIRDCLKCA